jgi:ribonuclease HII
MKYPDLDMEKAAWADGYRYIAGIDEAGRGAWAGPVAAAAVVLPGDDPDLLKQLDGVCDSKMLNANQRERLYQPIMQAAISVGIGMMDPEVIVEQGIAAATRQAMLQAIQSLLVDPDFLLIDYVKLPQANIPQKCIRKGDQKSLSIAAASIIAKVSRDRLMVEMAGRYPCYGFQQHKGYGTRYHRAAVEEHGISPVHRYTWKPFQTLEEDE